MTPRLQRLRAEIASDRAALLMLRLARELEGEPLAGPDWHQSLLDAMGLELEGVRPRMIGPGSHATLRMLLGFRHFFRHAHAVALDPAQLEPLRARAVASRAVLLADLDAIDAFLAGLATDEG